MMYYRVVDRPNTRCLTWRTQDRQWRARRTGDGARACSISHFATVIITCFVIFCCFWSVLFYVVAACCMPVVIVIAGPLPLPICINICRVTPTPTFPPPSTNYAQLAPYTFFLLCCVCVCVYCIVSCCSLLVISLSDNSVIHDAYVRLVALCKCTISSVCQEKRAIARMLLYLNTRICCVSLCVYVYIVATINKWPQAWCGTIV